jgi:hypothetical protein
MNGLMQIKMMSLDPGCDDNRPQRSRSLRNDFLPAWTGADIRGHCESITL